MCGEAKEVDFFSRGWFIDSFVFVVDTVEFISKKSGMCNFCGDRNASQRLGIDLKFRLE
jgi:hypothetical protein